MSSSIFFHIVSARTPLEKTTKSPIFNRVIYMSQTNQFTKDSNQPRRSQALTKTEVPENLFFFGVFPTYSPELSRKKLANYHVP